MEVLKSQLFVLRCIAFHRPHAHLAFLAHAPYRKQYDNQGQNGELANKLGQWEIFDYTLVFSYAHNTEIKYHPIWPVIYFYPSPFAKKLLRLYDKCKLKRCEFGNNTTCKGHLVACNKMVVHEYGDEQEVLFYACDIKTGDRVDLDHKGINQFLEYWKEIYNQIIKTKKTPPISQFTCPIWSEYRA